jgi:hypothetical protein
VVTSRMEQSLDRMFRRLPCSNNVELYKIEGDRVTSDVRLIFEQGFEDIKKNHDISTRPWPLKEHLDLLVERTGRFIIFAATVLKFVDSDLDRFSPEQQLEHILQNTSVAGAGDEYEAVDKLYLNVLERAARRTYDAMNIDPSLCARLRALIGTVILLQNPLSIPALAQLMGTPEGDVSRDIRALSAVLLIGPDTDSCGAPLVRIFHPSFRDFLLERCKDHQFLIDSVQQQQTLSVQCLQTLNKTLKYDICDIKDPTIPHSGVLNPTLSVRLKQHVPEAVQYACQFWINHVDKSRSLDTDLLLVLSLFITQHMLHWIEVLGLIGKLPHAIKYLKDTIAWSKVSESILCIIAII